jgi:ribonuclease HI
MQQVATTAGRHIHSRTGAHMVAYLDDWLIFGDSLNVPAILDTVAELGFQINYAKSILTPATALVYLGLNISTEHLTITPTNACLRQLIRLVSVLPQASRLDLQRIAGYVAWIVYAMGWPAFLSSLIYQRSAYWIHRFHRLGLLHQPRTLSPPLLSRQLYTDATPSSAAAVFVGPPQQTMVQFYSDHRPIAFAEMAAALLGLSWCIQQCLQQPTRITLHTDSMVVYHTLVKGSGWTLRSSALLQKLYVKMYILMNKAGHGLVCQWIPSGQNPADPLSRGVHAR